MILAPFELFARYWIGPGEEPACYMVTIGKGREVGFLFRFLLSYRGACLDWDGVIAWVLFPSVPVVIIRFTYVSRIHQTCFFFFFLQ